MTKNQSRWVKVFDLQVHSHRNRLSHSPVKIGIPEGPWSGPLICTRRKMSLFAVTCIETSHYVSFVKHGPQPTDWLFFDSMADREGEKKSWSEPETKGSSAEAFLLVFDPLPPGGQNGFNIPQVKACPEVGRYLSLSEEELSRVDPASLRETVRRLLCDSYMCLYHSPELSLYRWSAILQTEQLYSALPLCWDLKHCFSRLKCVWDGGESADVGCVFWNWDHGSFILKDIKSAVSHWQSEKQHFQSKQTKYLVPKVWCFYLFCIFVSCKWWFVWKQREGPEEDSCMDLGKSLRAAVTVGDYKRWDLLKEFVVTSNGIRW